MNPQHQSEFTLNLLLLITRMAAQGDYPTIRQLGIRHDQIDKLQALSTQEIQQMALIAKARFVSIQFDSEALDVAISLGHQRVAQQHLIIALLRAGASKPIMNQLFGLTSLESTELRRFIALPKADGRPTIPNDQQQVDLWHSWQKIRQHVTELPLQLLELHQKSGIKVNAIWPLVQTWSQNASEPHAVDV